MMKKMKLLVCTFGAVFFMLSNCLLALAQEVNGTALESAVQNASYSESAVISLESYNITEGSFAPGQDVNLSVVFANPVGKHAVSNIMVTAVSPAANVHPAVGATNMITIPSITAGGSVTVDFPLQISETDLEATEYTIVFYIRYIDPVSKAMLSYDIMVTIPKDEESGASLSLDVLSADGICVEDLKDTLQMKIVNGGGTTCSNIKVVLDGDIKEPVEFLIPVLSAHNTAEYLFNIEYTGEGVQGINAHLYTMSNDGHETMADEKSITVQAQAGEASKVVAKGVSLSTKEMLIENAIIVVLALLIVLVATYRRRQLASGRKEIANGK